MGLLDPAPPPFEYEEWRRLPHLERIKPLAQDWALNGFGTPPAVYLLYIVKLVVYAGGGLLLISATTAGLGGLGDLGSWWTRTDLLPEGGGLDDALGGARARRRLAAADAALHADDRRRPLLAAAGDDAAAALAREGAGDAGDDADLVRRRALRRAARARRSSCCSRTGRRGLPACRPAASTPSPSAVLLGILAVLGLRDKVPFLAARAEIYGNLMIIFLFPLGNMIVAAQLVFVCIWWGAAASKLNRHFPFVVTVMISNTPWNRSRKAKRRLYTDHPEDLLPSNIGRLSAHLGTVIEFTLPLLLLVSSGGVARHDRRRRDGRSSTSTSSRPSRWRCRWSGTSS